MSAAHGYGWSPRIGVGWDAAGVVGRADEIWHQCLGRLRQLPPWLVLAPPAALLGCLYAREGNPVVGGGNSGEFQVMAHVLGIAHPPSYPLYLLLAHLAGRLPLAGEEAWRMNALTGAFGALAALLTGTLAVALQRRATGASESGARTTAAALLAGAVALVSVASMPRLWSLAVEAEVFTLHLTLVLAFSLALLTWEARLRRDAADADVALLVAALLAGLGLANHRTFLFSALAGALFVVLIRPQALRRWRLMLGCLGCFSLGLLPYLYVLRALVVPVPYLSPDDVRRLSLREVWYVLQGNASGETDGGQIVLRLLADPEALLGGARWLWRHVSEQLGPLGGVATILGMVGLGLLCVRRSAWVVTRLLGAGGAALFAMAYSLQPQGTDADRYLLPLEALVAIGVGVAAASTAGFAETRLRGTPRRLRRLAGGALGLAAASYWSMSLVGLAEATAFTPGPYRDYVLPNLHALQRDAVLCVPWPTTWGWRYAQHVQGVRPDVAVVARGTGDCLQHVVPVEFGRRAVYVPTLTGPARRSSFVFFPEGDLWKVVTRRRAIREGALLKSAGERIFLLTGGRRRWIVSLQVFQARGFRWEDVRLTPDYILDDIPEDEPLVD